MGRHTDVIEDFICNSENPRYNRDYRLWRRHNKTQFIYRFSGNTGENVYVEGGASVKENAAAAEQTALAHCSILIGLSMLIYLLSELLGRSVLIAVLRLFGSNIHMDFLTFYMKGSQWSEAAAQILIDIIKYGIPAIILLRASKIPRRVAMPLHFAAPPELFAAIGSGMIIAGIQSLTARDADIELSQRLFTYKDSAAVFTYGLFEVLIVPILAEMLMRGGIFQLLRQFGDTFAIVSTAFISFLCPNTIANRISLFLIGLACGYLMVRSGSVSKCIILRSVYYALVYAKLILVYTSSIMPLWQYTLLLFSVGTLLAAAFVRIRRNKLQPDNPHTALDLRRKILAVTQTVTALPWLAVSAILTLLQMFY